MKDMFQVLESKLKDGQDGVLATIVASSGSTPRGEGAHMVVTMDGRVCGTVGGGAVEHYSELAAKEVLASKISRTEHFRLNQNQIQDLGMICGGNVDVHFQYIPANQASTQLTMTIGEFYQEKEEFWLLLDMTRDETKAEAGAMAVCGKHGKRACMNLSEHTVAAAQEKLLKENYNGKIVQIETNGHKFYCEKMLQPGKVYIFGGGHVSQALVPALAAVDFRCIVLEDREEFCRPELFSGAEDTILISNDRILESVDIGAEDYVCVMTRGHKDDLKVQAQILKTSAAYIGVIGSRHKKASVFAKLKEQGFTDTDLDRVTSPIGLNIGGETPAEIAVSITAQLIQKRAGK